MSTPAPLQAQEIGTVSPLYEVDALHREVDEIDQMIRWGEFTPELLKKIQRTKKRALGLKREGKI